MSRHLLSQIGDVLHDLPAFLTAPLYRRWHLRWGATPSEVADVLPGDDLFPNAQYRSTRAITIDAPPEAVWPWLVQVGSNRAGFYSDDLLDNLGRPSADSLLPEHQHLGSNLASGTAAYSAKAPPWRHRLATRL
jgi:hypothetical protein